MYREIIEELENLILKSLPKGVIVKKERLGIAHPQNEVFGDYTSTVALVPIKSGHALNKKSPREVAEEIAGKIPTGKESDLIESVKVVGAFINFTLKKGWLVSQLQNVLKETDKFGWVDKKDGKGLKVMFEYGTSNTHKIPHIGHLFSYTAGESLSRLTEATGTEVIRNNYQGDVGPHVAKCLWALMKNKPNDPSTEKEQGELLQKMYQEGATAYKENETAKVEIDNLNKRIYAKDPEIAPIWGKTREWSINYYNWLETRIGSEFKRHYYESEIAEIGKQIVKDNAGKVFEESDGATVFKGEKYGFHTRVFITKKGTPTYEAKDLGLQSLKMQEFSPDHINILTGSEQNNYFDVVIKALELVDPKKFKDRVTHIGTGLVSLKSGKMASRTGNIIGANELLDKAAAAIKKYIDERDGLSAEEKDEIAEKVGLGAVKYSFLKGSIFQNTVFDFEASLSFEGDSGPYLQYSYARARAILRDAKYDNESAIKETSSFTDQFKVAEEVALLRTIYRFPEVVADAAQGKAPNLVCTYLFDLARKFSAFYNACPVLKADTEDQKRSRLLLVAAVAQIIKNGLWLLGIETLEKM